MSQLCFLHPSIPVDIAPQILSLLDRPSIRALRSTSKNHQQIVESSPCFSEAEKKVFQVIKKFIHLETTYENLPEWQKAVSHLCKSTPFSGIFRTIFPCVQKTLHLKEKIVEVACDHPVSLLFGSQQEFDSLPELIPSFHRILLDNFPYRKMSSPIMRYRLPQIPGRQSITKKAALLIRTQCLTGDRIVYHLKCYVYLSPLKKWLAYNKVPRNDLVGHLQGALLTDLETGKKTEAYCELRELVLNKKFTDSSGVVFTVK